MKKIEESKLNSSYSDKLEKERKKAEELIKEKQKYLYNFKISENQFKYFNKDKYVHQNLTYLIYNKFTEEELNYLKDQIYSKLKEIFPDCLIENFNEYLSIDWN